MAATYTKLRDGSWGVRVTGAAVKAGDRVTVTKKSGESKVEVIDRVLWTGNGVSLCSVRGSGAPARSGHSPRAGRRNYEDECELCGGNKYTCGHCIGW